MNCAKCGSEGTLYFCRQGVAKLLSSRSMEGWNCIPVCVECGQLLIEEKMCPNCSARLDRYTVVVEATFDVAEEGRHESEKRVEVHCPRCMALMGRPNNLKVVIEE